MAVFVRNCIFVVLVAISIASVAQAESGPEEKILLLKQQIDQLSVQLELLQQEVREQKDKSSEQSEKINQLHSQLTEVESKSETSFSSSFESFTIGGYGDIHANFEDDSDSDVLDFHRIVLYLGYDFSEWISFHSEWELEHAFVSDDSSGEFLIEQAYFDFLLSDMLNIRTGRILTPMGITNRKHEPTLFNGVERPSFDKYIIPSTWSSDGVGIFGQLASNLTYEAYVVGGLDGSQFGEKSGIRDGRIKERASLYDLAYTGRLDYYHEMPQGQDLRLGISGYYGGLNNGNNGSNPGIDSEIAIYSTDFEYSIDKFDFRGAMVHSFLDDPEHLGSVTQDVAKETFGWYLEAGYHFMPEEWKKGKLKDSDAVFFVRYDDYDTQYKMPSGIDANPQADRNEWTFGLNFYPTSNMVIKADYQVLDDSSNDNLGNRFNIGLGWIF